MATNTYDKNNAIQLGVPGAPWPTMIEKKVQAPGKNGKTIVTYELGVIESADKALEFHSARPYLEVLDLLIRGMPVRGMLPAFENLVNRARRDQNNMIAFLRGDPGGGKSYLSVLLGKAVDPRGPVVTSAGGRNLEYLLWQNVFDTEECKPIVDAINKGLSDQTLSTPSLKALRELGKHFSEENGRRALDWNALEVDSKITSEKLQSVLEAVRSSEGWSAKSMGIGFKIVEGPLIKADRSGQLLVLDEINKCKEGSEGPLQIVWQVKNGGKPVNIRWI